MHPSLTVCALLYAVCGWALWRIVVLPSKPSGELSSDREVMAWRRDARQAEARGEIAMMLPKATFVLLWPIAIAFGFVIARIGSSQK